MPISALLPVHYFNPLPPHGGRPGYGSDPTIDWAFQSTPSAWRETLHYVIHVDISRDFNPLPPHGGRLKGDRVDFRRCGISIHSLRMEGDITTSPKSTTADYFNPLPPHGGRQEFLLSYSQYCHFNPLPPHGGRHGRGFRITLICNFNPLPPHGGRPLPCPVAGSQTTFQSTPSAWRETDQCQHITAIQSFQSTPSAWRETKSTTGVDTWEFISIHSLRMEGDKSTTRTR